MNLARIRTPLPDGVIYQDMTHAAHHVFFFGMTGTGKTTLALHRLKAARHPWKIVFDPERQWSARLGCPAVERWDDLARTLAAHGCACLDLTPSMGSNKRRQIEAFLNFVWTFSGRFRGDKLIVLDDCSDYLPKPDSTFLEHIGNEVAGAGRRRGIDFYAMTRNVTELSTVFRASASEVYAFAQPAGNCAKALESEFGFPADQVKALRPGQFLHFTAATGKRTSGTVKLGSA